jgi:hypothetical protein
MSRGAGGDPAGLDPSRVAFHQLVAFAPGRIEQAAGLERSPLFRVRRFDRGLVAEWLQHTPESDPSLFPLGRVSVHGEQGVLLEALSDDRLRELHARAEETGLGYVSSDELRVFPVSDVLVHPERLLQPLDDAAGRTLTPRDVAVDFLRMGWAFLPHPDLGGRTPEAVLHTGRGRAALQQVIDRLPRALAQSLPGFPSFSTEDLRTLLLPAEAPPTTPAPKAHPAAQRSED